MPPRVCFRLRLARVAAAVVLLAGCAGHGTLPATAPALVCGDSHDATATANACAQALMGLGARIAVEKTAAQGWSLQGRAAIHTGRQGGSARIEWSQSDLDSYSVTLSAPVTRQSWRLDVTPRGAALAGLDGGPRQGPDAAALLREATGWDIPVDSLRYWMRGLPAPGSAAVYRFGADNALIGLDQSGWRIGFSRTSAEELPSRVEAERGDSRVRLLIDQWSDATGE